ncbi:right-handed parallel beta-helix repeat-containing protein [Hymenobacter sp.]|jgi:uncharacterized repeat protein (TIGR01451 family)|uniref:right-handed parallel beta-helix repeat-containing protein n=1 Tax=Hymenobacter sp. TaxID=1898978 RepID=UPI002ED95A39
MTSLLRHTLGLLLVAAAKLLVPDLLLAQAACSSTYNTTTVPTAGGTSGLFAEYYAGDFRTGQNEANPNTFFTANTAGQSGIAPQLNYRSPSASSYVVFPVTSPPATGATDPDLFSARYRGSIYLEAGAPYTFYMSRDDASYLFIGREAASTTPTASRALIKNDGTRQYTASATGLHDMQVLFWENTGTAILRMEYSGGPRNLARQVIPQTALCAGPSGKTYAINEAPSVDDVTNAQLLSNGTRAALNPGFSGFDADGSIDSYTITSLPAQGTLSYNNSTTTTPNYVAISAPFPVSVANLGRLAYTTPTSATGTFSFQYQATDNQNAVSGNTATYRLPVNTDVADLSTTLASPATAPQGSLVYFTATISNAGPANATGIIPVIYLPAGLTGISLSNSGTYNSSNGQATWDPINLNNGQSTTRSIAFTMPAQPVSASASSDAPLYSDANTSNNVGTAYTAPTQVADVAVAINGPTRVVTNQTITYTIVTTNQGPSAAASVTPSAKLVTGLAGIVVSNGGSYNATSGQVSWPTVTTLNVGDYLAYTVRFNASATVGTTVTGEGSATSNTANGDPAAANNDGTNGQARIATEIISTTAAATECVNPEIPDPGFQATPNTYYSTTGAVSAGATTLTLGTILSSGNQKAVQPGDLIVIMQMQGAELNTTNTDAYGDGIDANNAAIGNLQNGNFRAGLYEYAVVRSVSGNSVTLNTPLINSYVSSDATAIQGQQRYQVIRVPRNGTLTLTDNIRGARWDGRAGGVVVLDVSGTLNFNGKTIDMAGKGFRGGAGQQFGGNGSINDSNYRHSNTLNTSSNKGEGTAGTPRYLNDADNFAAFRAGTATTPFLDTQASGLLPASVTDGYPNGDRARGAPGNAGGGGTDGNPGANDQNSGGGGGGNAGRGGNGGNAWDSNDPSGGYGGADFTQATPSRLIMGGGGGGGTNNNGTIASTTTYPANTGIPAAGATNANGVPLGGFTSSGAAGGGIVLVRAANLTGSGTINVTGADVPYVPANDGSGGGGAGGSVLLLINAANGNPNSTILQNITVLANGGKGGSNTGGGSPHGPGGGGAGGVIFASSRLNAATVSNPGANGTTFNFETYGSGVGAADEGQAQTGVTRADVPNQISGCPADVVTTLTTSAATSAPGTTITFTLTTVNNGPGVGLNVVPTLTLVPNLPASAFTNLGGGTYDAATGVVTFPTTSQLSTSTTLTYAVTFRMPTETVIGQAASTADGDLDPRTANNDGTSTNARVRVEPIFAISGRVFDDVNYGGGRGRNYATAEASALNSGVPAGVSGSATGSAGVRVELYDSNGALVATTTSGADGLYGFSNIISSNRTSYTLRVVNSTVRSARNEQASGVLPVQTFRVDNGRADLERVGGEAPEKVDAAANPGNQTLTELTQGSNTPQSIAVIIFGPSGRETGVDFGFNFSTIVNTRDAGQGSLRQFIANTNALPNLQLDQAAASSGGSDPVAGVETSIFMISDGRAHNGLRAGLVNQLTIGVASIVLNTATNGALPALTDSRTALNGTTQTQNVGNTNTATLGTGGTVGGSASTATALSQVSGPEVQLVGTPGQINSEYGLTLSAASLSVTGFSVYGFGKTAGSTTGADIYVTGDAITGTVITGNVLGAAATVTFQDPGASLRSPGSGIYLANFNSTTLGSVAATITNNLIGFHGGSGIENLASGSPTTLLVQNNEIRSNAQSNASADGIHMGSYGGTVSGNLLIANQGTGLDLQGTTGSVTMSGNTVQANGANGTATAGIRLDGAGNVVLQNVLSSNSGAGVLAMATTSVSTISQNSTTQNGTLGIDLLTSSDDQQRGTSSYVTRNDDNDSDTGANGLLNIPVLTQAVTDATNLILTGFAPTGASLEFFVPSVSGQGFGQGQLYLFTRTEGTTGAATNTNTDTDTGRSNYYGRVNGFDHGAESAASRFTFRIPLSSLTADQRTAINASNFWLTATATTATGSNSSTSEFSGNIQVMPNRPLPVTLVAFTAQATGNDAYLAWRTAQEVNSDYFAVERSLDGLTFREVGRVAAQGTTAQSQSYILTDAGVSQQAQGRVVYYRLRQVDKDGTSVTSAVQTVRFTASATLAVYPNPTSGSAMLDLTRLPQGEYKVQVLDAVGRVLYSTQAPGAAETLLPATQWPQGTYLIQVTNSTLTPQTLRLIRH